MLLNDTEKFFFESAFNQSVDALVQVLEKPEFAEPRIQNLVMLELIGHIVLSMHAGVKAIGPELEDAGVESLTAYLGFLAGILANGGRENLPMATPARVN